MLSFQHSYSLLVNGVCIRLRTNWE